MKKKIEKYSDSAGGVGHSFGLVAGLDFERARRVVNFKNPNLTQKR